MVFILSVAWNGKSVEDEMVKNLGCGVRGLASQTRREAGIPLLSGAWPSHFKTWYCFLIIMQSCIINFFPSHVDVKWKDQGLRYIHPGNDYDCDYMLDQKKVARQYFRQVLIHSSVDCVQIFVLKIRCLLDTNPIFSYVCRIVLPAGIWALSPEITN